MWGEKKKERNAQTKVKSLDWVPKKIDGEGESFVVMKQRQLTLIRGKIH